MTNIENKCLKISCKKKKQVGKFIKDQIEKNKHILKKSHHHHQSLRPPKLFLMGTT